MTPRPARVREIISVPLPRPRTPEMMRRTEFHTLQSRLLALLISELTTDDETGSSAR